MNRYSPDLSGRVLTGTVDVGGLPIHYWDYPAVATAVEPRTMLVVHGFRGDHHGLERVVEALPDTRILMPDLPGFGESPAFSDREHSIESYAEAVAGLLDALSLDRNTVLLGHSFGSIVASYFVADHPDRVAALILVNPIAAPALEGPKGLLSKLAQFYYWTAAKLPERAGQTILRSSLIVQAMSVAMTKTRDSELRKFIHAQHHAYFSSFASRAMLLESFKASINGNVRQVAARLRLPTLLVAGEKDDVTALPEQRVLLGMLPEGELEVIDGVGHLIHYETPREAASAIRSFLQAHPREDR